MRGNHFTRIILLLLTFCSKFHRIAEDNFTHVKGVPQIFSLYHLDPVQPRSNVLTITQFEAIKSTSDHIFDISLVNLFEIYIIIQFNLHINFMENYSYILTI